MTDYNEDLVFIQKKIKQMEQRRSTFWKPQQGKNVIRVLPKYKSVPLFFFEVDVHYIGKTSKPLACRAVLKDSCMVCNLSEKMLEHSKARVRDAGADMERTTQYYLNIVVDPHTADALNQIWRCSEGLFQELLTYYADGDYGDFSDAKEGYDIILRREGEGMQTRYQPLKLRKESSQIDKASLRGRKDLSKLFTIPSKREMKEALKAAQGGF